ncbi:unnamed protein product [Sphagnum compactum]
MPDQKLCTSEPRTAELQVFDDFAVRRAKLGCDKLFTGLRSSAASLRGGECREFDRVSTVLFSKEFGVKPWLCCADGKLAAAAGTSSLNALRTTAKSHHHPLATKQSLLASSDSTAKLRSTKSPKIIAPGLRKPSLKNVGSGPASLVQVAARAVVRSVGTTGSDQAKLQRKNLTAGHEAAFFHQSPAASQEGSTLKLEIVETHAAASINPPPEYRGVRVRPGVKGFLVEIRPKGWKKTIWLGTYPTSLEAARAYDAGIFYTGKSIPYNFQESKDSFSPLPEHLSLDDSDPEIMDQITFFVKVKAREAARRGKALEAAARKPRKVEPTLQGSQVLQTGNKKPDHIVSSSSSVNEVQGCCTSLATGLSSDKKGMSLHVKDEADSAGCSDLVNSDPLENLEPLPGNLGHYSTTEQELLPGDDHSLDCWGQIRAQTGVNGYSPQSGILEDKDLCITQQTSEYLTEEDMQVPDPPTCCFQSVFPSFENDGNLGNPATLGLQDSWGLLPASFDLGVWDPSLGSDGSLLQENFLNMEAYDSSYVWWHQAKQLDDLRFARTHELPQDVLLLCQNGEDASLKSGCINSVVQEPDDDDEFSVSLWQ